MKKRAYSSFEKESRVFAAVMLVIVILMMAVGVLELCGVFEKEEAVWKPTEIYPMANANISWMQTHHPGPWDGDPNGH